MDEALRLARLLHRLMPDEPTSVGLLALMLLTDARRSARVSPEGLPVLLADQDRSRWAPALIEEGVVLLGEGLRRTPDRPDPYVVQAALAACHDLAPTVDATNWAVVCSWYDVLLMVQDTPTARLARAVAVGERDGPRAGLAALETVHGLEPTAALHGARAELLLRSGDPDAAAEAFDRALAQPVSRPQRTQLAARLAVARERSRRLQGS